MLTPEKKDGNKIGESPTKAQYAAKISTLHLNDVAVGSGGSNLSTRLHLSLDLEANSGSRRSRQIVSGQRLTSRKPVKLTSASMFDPNRASASRDNMVFKDVPESDTQNSQSHEFTPGKCGTKLHAFELGKLAHVDSLKLPALINLKISNSGRKEPLEALDFNTLKTSAPRGSEEESNAPNKPWRPRRTLEKHNRSFDRFAPDTSPEVKSTDHSDVSATSESEWEESDTDSTFISSEGAGSRKANGRDTTFSKKSCSSHPLFTRDDNLSLIYRKYRGETPLEEASDEENLRSWVAEEIETRGLRADSPETHFRPPTKSSSGVSAATPPRSPFKSRLTSPKKSKSIPPTPYRPSIDAFWSQDTIDAWNDEYSPRKKLNGSPSKIHSDENQGLGEEAATNISSPRKAKMSSPMKNTKEVSKARKAFNEKKVHLAETFFNELDFKIGNGEVQRLAKEAGGVKIFWSKKLNTTAGRAHWKRETVKTMESNAEGFKQIHNASIELAEKVIDNEERLLNVIAHEYCHLANFMISNIRTHPHGPSFKRWAARVTAAFRDRGVEVTTKHDYTIAYKYAWVCTNDGDCGIQYERHSRSIDPRKHTCGKCKSTLVQIRPPPRGNAQLPPEPDNIDSARQMQTDVAKKGEYQLFVKQNFHIVKTQLGPKSPMKDVMKELGSRYRTAKNASAAAPHSITEIREHQDPHEPLRDAIVLDSDSDDGYTEKALGAMHDKSLTGPSSTLATSDNDIADVARVLDFLNINDR